MELNVLTVVTNYKCIGHHSKEININMTPEEDKIFRSVFGMPACTHRRRSYILVHDKTEHLPEFMLGISRLHIRMR